MKIALLQHNSIWKNKEANFRIIEKKFKVLKNVAVVVLPELAFTGYCLKESDEIKERIPGLTSNFLRDMSKKYKLCIVAGLAEDENSKLPKNTCLVYNNGKLISKYQKIHPFSYVGENIYYNSGNKLSIFTLGGYKCGCVICYDLRFPELFRALVKKGAEIIFVIANWPYPREDHWLALTKARAIESQAYIVAVNRVGKEPNKKYFGLSRIIDPWGIEVISAGKDKEKIAVGEIKKERIKEIRTNFPYLKDIKNKLYARL